ncbi:MAG TPA: hypothetical protein VNS55_07275 [Nocardioides sp.]|nr:hypothetical protein [Nocardioides sp.]
MSRNLGTGTPAPPPATRVARSGWRDPRLWIGVLLVTVSVVLGARVLAAADDTVAVWSFAEEHGPGSVVTGDDLVATRVRFDDPAELDLYLPADESVPDDVVLRRGVGAGELLARSALAPAEELGLQHVPLEVSPGAVEGSVAEGSVVDVYVDDASRRRGPAGRPAPALADVTVVDAPPMDDAFAVSGTRQLVLAVPEDDVPAFEALLSALDEPRLHVITQP